MTPEEREGKLLDWLKQSETIKCVWGRSDCSAWPAKWVEFLTGKPVPLPQYSSRDEADMMIANAGSLEVLWGRALQGIAEPIGTDPGLCKAGDVGILNTKRYGQTGVIIASPRLAYIKAEGPGGGVIRPRNMVQIWRV